MYSVQHYIWLLNTQTPFKSLIKGLVCVGHYAQSQVLTKTLSGGYSYPYFADEDVTGGEMLMGIDGTEWSSQSPASLSRFK